VAKVISIFNQAGGVSKSTVTHNLGYHLATRKHGVLVVDMDPQASLTTFMGLEPPDLKRTMYDALSKEEPLPIEKDLDGLDLAPSNILLADCEQELVLALKREERLQEALAPVRKKYDFILIDCPPSLGLLSLISLVASNHVLVPIETQYKAFKGTDSLLKTISKVQIRLNKSLRIAGFLPTKYASRNSLDRQVLLAMQKQLSPLAPVFSPIPTATSLALASKKGVPLALCSGSSRNQPILALFDELAEAMEEV
jgi:chromosome partitioning protein